MVRGRGWRLYRLGGAVVDEARHLWQPPYGFTEQVWSPSAQRFAVAPF